MKKISNLAKGILCVAGGFLIHFSLGTLYTFGNMSPYVSSYLRNRTESTWATSGTMVWVFSITIFAKSLVMALGGMLDQKIGSRFTCLIGGWTMSLGTALTYLTVKANIWLVFVTYGFVVGLGTGLAYSVALAAPIRWFPDKKGLISGVVVAGFGLGSLVFNIVQTKFINPWNVPPVATNFSAERYFEDESVLNRVPWCFVLIGLSYAMIQLLGVIILMDAASKNKSKTRIKKEDKLEMKEEKSDAIEDEPERKDDVSEMKDDKSELKDEKLETAAFIGKDETDAENPHNNTVVVSSVASQLNNTAQYDYTVNESVKARNFWILWGTFSFNGVVIVTISSLYKSFGQTFISDDSFFAIVGAVAAIFNCIGRVFWGKLVDNFIYRIIMSAHNGSMMVIMGTFYTCYFVTSTIGSRAMYFIWVCMLFFCLSGNFALFPAATAQSFGNKNFAIIYGIVFTGYGLSSIIGGLICSLLLKWVNFYGIFIIATVSALGGIILTQFYQKPTFEMPKKK